MVGWGGAAAGAGGGMKLTNVVKTEPGEALAFALTLITISASICVTCEGLQGGVMEVYLDRSSQLKKRKKLRSLRFRNRYLHGKVLMSLPFSAVSKDLQ